MANSRAFSGKAYFCLDGENSFDAPTVHSRRSPGIISKEINNFSRDRFDRTGKGRGGKKIFGFVPSEKLPTWNPHGKGRWFPLVLAAS